MRQSRVQEAGSDPLLGPCRPEVLEWSGCGCQRRRTRALRPEPDLSSNGVASDGNAAARAWQRDCDGGLPIWAPEALEAGLVALPGVVQL